MSLRSFNSHLFLELSSDFGFLSATSLCSIQPSKGFSVSEMSTMIAAIQVPEEAWKRTEDTWGRSIASAFLQQFAQHSAPQFRAGSWVSFRVHHRDVPCAPGVVLPTQWWAAIGKLGGLQSVRKQPPTKDFARIWHPCSSEASSLPGRKKKYCL